MKWFLWNESTATMYAINLPHGYDEPHSSYPGLYCLHGGGDDHRARTRHGEVQAIANQAIRESKTTTMIILMHHEDKFHPKRLRRQTPMKRASMLSAIWLLLSFAGQLPLQATPDFGTLPDPFSGRWEGVRQTTDKTAPLHATVIASKDGYEVTLRAIDDPRSEAIVHFNGTTDHDILHLAPTLSLDRSEVIEVQDKGVLINTLLWSGVGQGERLTGTFRGGAVGQFELTKRAFVPSVTLGLAAPAGATVLFDGTDLAAWEDRRRPEEAIQWIITPGGGLEVVSHRDGKRNKQDLQSKEIFGDYRMHLEFKLAYKPAATGQGRSNSGIFHLGYYETQILDSFGLYGRDNECGGIYKTREPDSNAAYPAGLWQTYDIEVQAPRFNRQGKKTANARLTVRLNGVLVHDDVEVPKPTAGGQEGPTGPIVLQDHGNPVEFRNIWVEPR